MLHRRELSSSSSLSPSPPLPAELSSSLVHASSPRRLSPHVSGWWEPAHLAESSPASWLLSPLPPLPSLAAFSTAASHDSLHSELGPPSSPVLSSSSFLLTASAVAPDSSFSSSSSSSAATTHSASATDTAAVMTTASLTSMQHQQQKPQQRRVPAADGTAAAAAAANDKQRRRMEQAAVRRLEELCGSEQLASVAGSSSSQSHVGRHKRLKSHKLSVLQKSAARIERLEQLLTSSELSARQSEAQLRVMSEEINSVVLREQQLMQWMDASRTLNDMALLGEHIVITLVESPTCRLLNANQAFFAVTGFTPGAVLSRQLGETPVRVDSGIARPLTKDERSAGSESRDGGPDRHSQWIPLRPCRQYPRTVQLLQELLAGERESFSAPHRCRWADGCCYEMQASFWVASAEWVEEADGRRRRRPLTFVIATPIESAFKVEGE